MILFRIIYFFQTYLFTCLLSTRNWNRDLRK